MKSRELLYLGARRFALLFGVSLLFVGGISELAHLLMRSETDRAPETIELVIPAGAAERVAAGEEPPGIPDAMTFVVGDTLLVRNEDVVDHQLGPIWVPAGATGTMKMESANAFDYSCSFSTSKYLGLDIRERTTLSLRLVALAYVTPATALFFFVYSLALYPLKPSVKKE